MNEKQEIEQNKRHFQVGPNSDQEVFYYKIVAKTLGKYFSIYDGRTEYALGQTLYQEAFDHHKGGYYVYSKIEQVIFSNIPYKKGGLFIAPRTILKCLCWGNRIEYDNGILAFSYICPIQDLGLPIGYKSSKTALQDAVQGYEQKLKNIQMKVQNPQQQLGGHIRRIRQRPKSSLNLKLNTKYKLQKQPIKSRMLEQ